jgi:hypothetical protein
MLNLCRTSKITGKLWTETAKSQDEEDKFLDYYFGINAELDVLKIRGKKKLVENRSVDQVQLFGWGDNKSGELAHSGLVAIPAPKEIELPGDLKKVEEQDKKTTLEKRHVSTSQIFCGRRVSGLVSASGELWMAGNKA